MGQILVKQPNGKYGVFSSVVDDFIALDLTPETVKEFLIEEYMEVVERQTKGWIEDADRDSDFYSYAKREGDGLKRWRECLADIRRQHGAEKARITKEAVLTGEFEEWLAWVK